MFFASSAAVLDFQSWAAACGGLIAMVRARVRQSFAVVVLVLLVGVEFGYSQAHWVASWAASPFLAEGNSALPQDDLSDATLRQTVHLSLGGAELRVHLSNRAGTAPLHFSSVHIARAVAAGSDKIAAGTDQALAFSGKPDVTLPAGADYVSDPIKFSASPLSDVAITIHLDQKPENQTGHPAAYTTSYLAQGDKVSAADLPDAKKIVHWYFIEAVDVMAQAPSAAIVAFGDSITDGHGSTVDSNDRWPDDLAKRLQADWAKRTLAVVNEGIGGNRLLLDRTGPNALARFDQDVLAQAGVRYLIILEGINDLGHLTQNGEISQAEHDSLVLNMIAAYQQIIARAHAHGIKVYGGTLVPFVGAPNYHPGPQTEADREAVNQWIRTSGQFDAVIDLDKAIRDPEHPNQMLPKFDFGDHLHPSAAGYAAMAGAIPLSLF
jgi:lysophospholipase L1-like esterase